jgi:hypothetical protein
MLRLSKHLYRAIECLPNDSSEMPDYAQHDVLFFSR